MLSARSTSSDFKKQEEKQNDIVIKKCMMFKTLKKQESVQREVQIWNANKKSL